MPARIRQIWDRSNVMMISCGPSVLSASSYETTFLVQISRQNRDLLIVVVVVVVVVIVVIWAKKMS